MHPGDDEPFIRMENLQFKPGEWTLLVGDSGSGKSSLLKAINGLWPHGRGRIMLPRNVRTFYAAQDVHLPAVSLRELVCLPDAIEAHSDAEVAAALANAGLAPFAGDLVEEGRDNQSWDQLLSGGQKQALMLARILLLRPGLMFLDEPTSALDSEATVGFHQAIRDNCPGATVITVMHDATPPRSAKGEEFYDGVLAIADGRVTKTPMLRRTDHPVGPARVRPHP